MSDEKKTSGPKVRVTITDEQNKMKLPSGTRMLIRRACTAVLVNEKFEEDAEVSVLITDDDTIHEMNREHRNIDKSTDVLSFPLSENGVYDKNPENGFAMLGDIVISIEHVVAQAEEYGHGLKREVAYLTVHSMLHLLGYDHENGGIEKMKMREKEELSLTQLGLKRNGSYYTDGE